MPRYPQSAFEAIAREASRICDLAHDGNKEAFKAAKIFCKNVIKKYDDYEAYSFEKDLKDYEYDYKCGDERYACRGLVGLIERSTEAVLKKMEAHNSEFDY
ncbi:MAG: hypothetical protein J1F31_03680 [Erysipelotrichales bacterium]|nr:hypothetical protein [Erysipelotrichales bacterium]